MVGAKSTTFQRIRGIGGKSLWPANFAFQNNKLRRKQGRPWTLNDFKDFDDIAKVRESLVISIEPLLCFSNQLHSIREQSGSEISTIPRGSIPLTMPNGFNNIEHGGKTCLRFIGSRV